MSDIIQLLPDNVANQIAAGEVVQRPASVVKELMENAIDAQSTEVVLQIKESGKALIQIIDNGIGMSTTDARLCFERHATSKIKKAEDLYNLYTKGFRGEALASIAAVAQVVLKTKQSTKELGEHIEVEGNIILKQEPVACSIGTSIAVKNLFYNIPARRNFLKSDNVEYKHIVEEFIRIALTHPEVAFKFYSDEVLIFQLPIQNFKQRICGIFGSNYDERLVPIEENTTVVSLNGFIGKPEFARKTRGEQYFFVNKRFIKSPYFNHAIAEAYNQLISKDAFVSYFIFLEVDTTKLDVNIHPTKTEVKFEDEKIIYTYIKSAARRSVGQYNIAPSLDFDAENNFIIDYMPSKGLVQQPVIKVDPNYNPFDSVNTQQGSNYKSNYEKKDNRNWEPAYDILLQKEVISNLETNSFNNAQKSESNNDKLFLDDNFKAVQAFNKYIFVYTNNALLVLDQHLAHQRVLYDQLLQSIAQEQIAIQQCLFPQQMQLTPANYVLLKNLFDAFKLIGFDLSDFGNNTIVINGIPAFTADNKAVQTIEIIIEKLNHEGTLNKEDTLTLIAKATAQSLAIKSNRNLNQPEIDALVKDWHNCHNKMYAPNGKKIAYSIAALDIEQKLK